MPSSTYTLIKGETLASSAASYTFSAIPSTFTDLVLRVTLRHTTGFINTMAVKINSGDTVSYRILYGANFTAGSFSGSATSSDNALISDGGSNTSNTFSNGEVYFPNYTLSSYKPFLAISSGEQSGETGWQTNLVANSIISTNPITSITILDAVNGYSMVAGSSFYLYGIKSS
jgi:hypothetical protein